MKSIRHKLLALSVSCALVVSLAGCGVNVTGVALDLPDSLEKGSTITATPEYTFDGATPESAALTKKLDALDMSYSSSDPAVVMVDENGNIVDSENKIIGKNAPIKFKVKAPRLIEQIKIMLKISKNHNEKITGSKKFLII